MYASWLSCGSHCSSPLVSLIVKGTWFAASSSWFSSLFKKAFDSINQDSLWNILQHYEYPSILFNLIKSFYTTPDALTEGHNGMIFDLKIGVKDAWCLQFYSTWPLIWSRERKTTKYSQRGIYRCFFSTLENLDLANDLALMSYSHLHIQQSKTRPADCKPMDSRLNYKSASRRQRQWQYQISKLGHACSC